MLRLKGRKRMLREVGKAFAVGFMAAAVLWLTAGYPVVSQQVHVPTREQILQGLEQALAVTLTASEGDILDVENTIFYSDPDLLSIALVPNHPSSRSWELIPALIEGEDVEVTIGALYLEGDWPGLPDLVAGTYMLKLRPDRVVVAVDSEGNEITCGCWQRENIADFFIPEDFNRVIANFDVSYQPARQAQLSIAQLPQGQAQLSILPQDEVTPSLSLAVGPGALILVGFLIFALGFAAGVYLGKQTCG